MCRAVLAHHDRHLADEQTGTRTAAVASRRADGSLLPPA
jgi:hypothetical protein